LKGNDIWGRKTKKLNTTGLQQAGDIPFRERSSLVYGVSDVEKLVSLREAHPRHKRFANSKVVTECSILFYCYFT
jgi:hypothetical protein